MGDPLHESGSLVLAFVFQQAHELADLRKQTDQQEQSLQEEREKAAISKHMSEENIGNLMQQVCQLCACMCACVCARAPGLVRFASFHLRASARARVCVVVCVCVFSRPRAPLAACELILVGLASCYQSLCVCVCVCVCVRVSAEPYPILSVY